MGYVLSSDIAVFPSARRAAGNATYLKARKMTEENIVGILNHVNDYENYVLSDTVTSPFEFVIGGYYVSVSDQNLLENSAPLYAGIKIVATGDYTELVGQDEGNVYKGVRFEGSDEEFDSGYIVLELIDGDGNVPQSSRKKFTPDRLDFSQIAYIGGITVS